MKFSPPKRRRPPAIIIVSLIDVLLVVLIFLMVSTTFRKENLPALKLALPQSKTAQPGATKETKPMIISIGTNFPFFYVDNRAVTYDRLQTELQGAVARDPQVRVAIKADKNAPFGEVVKVLDATKLANVSGNALSVYTAEKPAAR